MRGVGSVSVIRKGWQVWKSGSHETGVPDGEVNANPRGHSTMGKTVDFYFAFCFPDGQKAQEPGPGVGKGRRTGVSGQGQRREKGQKGQKDQEGSP